MYASQPLPAGTTDGDRFARELALLLGPAYQPAEGTTLIAEDLHTLGDALAAVYATQSRARDQALADQATDMLVEWETRLELPSDDSLTTAQRQAALRAKRRATGGNSEARTVAAVRALTSANVVLVPNAASACTHFPRAVFHWLVVVPAADWSDARLRVAIQRVLDQIKPAYTRARPVVTAAGQYDSASSLADRDTFGA